MKMAGYKDNLDSTLATPGLYSLGRSLHGLPGLGWTGGRPGPVPVGTSPQVQRVKSGPEISGCLDMILDEISAVVAQVREDEAEAFCRRVLAARRVVCCGAGRVGYSVKAFAMRLAQLGLEAYMLGDTTVPGIRSGDLLVVASGSGETKSILTIVERARRDGAEVALVTGQRQSSMAVLANSLLIVPAPNKTSAGGMKSAQPMTTLNEQCYWLLFDALVLKLMGIRGETQETMKQRCSNLE